MAQKASGERTTITWSLFGELLESTRLQFLSTSVVSNVLLPFLQVVTQNNDCITRKLFNDLHSFTITDPNEVIILPAKQYFNNASKKTIECASRTSGNECASRTSGNECASRTSGNEFSDHEHYSHGELHCDTTDRNGRTIPAISTSHGKYWYFRGRLGRPDSGATAITEKTLQWHENGVHHREDSPAYVEFDKPIWDSVTRQFIYDHIDQDWDVDIWTDNPDSPKPIKMIWYNHGQRYDRYGSSENIFVHAGYQAPKTDPWQTFKDFLWFMLPCFITIVIIIVVAAFGEVPENPLYF